MNKVISHSLFTDFDIDLFKAGKHFRLYEKLGAHLLTLDGIKGVYFAVWAPTAHSVSAAAKAEEEVLQKQVGCFVQASERRRRRWRSLLAVAPAIMKSPGTSAMVAGQGETPALKLRGSVESRVRGC